MDAARPSGGRARDAAPLVACFCSLQVTPSSQHAPPGLLRSGLGPSLLGVMHVVIQFPLYESLKARFAAHHPDRSEKLNL